MHSARVIRYGLLLASVTLLAGCASNSLYYWGDYSDSLEHRYEHEDIAQAEQLLREQMASYQNSGGTPATSDVRRVPPGMYADYGFLLFRRGDMAGAMAFFQREKEAFPESTGLMNKLIERIRKKTGITGPTATSPATPAGVTASPTAPVPVVTPARKPAPNKEKN